MSDATDYDPVECPVSDCAYRDAVRSVAAHVGRTDGDGHSWDRLAYEGARDFVETEKRRQRDGSDGDSVDSPGSAANPDERGDGDDDFEFGFEREALVLLELADEYDLSSLDDLGTAQLADLYSLLADLKNSADAARKEVRDAMLEDLREDCEITAELGSVRRRTYEYRSLEDEATVRDALDDAGVDPEAVKSFDRGKVEDAVAEAGIDEDEVFEVDERPQIRIADSNDDRRRERFERLDPAVQSLADENEAEDDS
ncbi:MULTISPECIES: hypothetical protein [Halorussus]|uniref:hypothetical protein n=1 Tax=Halorussus TaxID=1070314 RepID=UPI000E217876|nr:MULTISPECIES: hypothetical protein [Halorussus]NHN61013.1 hypothetical protein [Halorussus sp. JP-T4]